MLPLPPPPVDQADKIYTRHIVVRKIASESENIYLQVVGRLEDVAHIRLSEDEETDKNICSVKKGTLSLQEMNTNKSYSRYTSSYFSIQFLFYHWHYFTNSSFTTDITLPIPILPLILLYKFLFYCWHYFTNSSFTVDITLSVPLISVLEVLWI